MKTRQRHVKKSAPTRAAGFDALKGYFKVISQGDDQTTRIKNMMKAHGGGVGVDNTDAMMDILQIGKLLDIGKEELLAMPPDELERRAVAYATKQRMDSDHRRRSGETTEKPAMVQRVFDERDIEILKTLSKYEYMIPVDRLAVQSNIDRKTCSSRLPALIAAGYVVRKSERSGVAITPDGRSFIAGLNKP